MVKRILISNANGVNASGIKLLAHILQEFGQVTIVAPERERSASSHAITTCYPLHAVPLIETDSIRRFSLDGTPVDCIKWGIENLYSISGPDLVITGINAGANVGQDIFYSGTIAAAREANLYGIPSIAISAAADEEDEVHWDRVEKIVRSILPNLLKLDIPMHSMLNINIPAVSLAEVKGMKIVDIDLSNKRYEFEAAHHPKGKQIDWLTNQYHLNLGDIHYDHYLVKNGYVTLSPVRLAIDNSAAIAALTQQFTQSD